MMRPKSGVIGVPQTKVDLRHNHLLISRSDLVDRIGEQRRGVKRVRPNFVQMIFRKWDIAS